MLKNPASVVLASLRGWTDFLSILGVEFPTDC
jgi:hypothetical protein